MQARGIARPSLFCLRLTVLRSNVNNALVVLVFRGHYLVYISTNRLFLAMSCWSTITRTKVNKILQLKTSQPDHLAPENTV